MLLNKYFSFLILLGITLIVSGCPDNKSNLGADNEEFIGTYMVRDSLEVESLGFTDSIRFTVTRGTTYSFSYFENGNMNAKTKFCDHSGTIFDFGTAKASFVPTSISYNNCDSANIPRGTFAADFINHADTIVLFRRSTNLSATFPYDSIYIIKLLK